MKGIDSQRRRVCFEPNTVLWAFHIIQPSSLCCGGSVTHRRNTVLSGLDSSLLDIIKDLTASIQSVMFDVSAVAMHLCVVGIRV